MTEEYRQKALGNAAEEAACAYLQTQGLHLVEKNFRCRSGEIDLIMQDRDELVFVEVRLRKQVSHGDPLESVTSQKQDRIARTALFYLQQHKLLDQVYCRFDVLGLDTDHTPTWVRNAFEADCL